MNAQQKMLIVMLGLLLITISTRIARASEPQLASPFLVVPGLADLSVRAAIEKLSGRSPAEETRVEKFPPRSDSKARPARPYNPPSKGKSPRA